MRGKVANLLMRVLNTPHCNRNGAIPKQMQYQSGQFPVMALLPGIQGLQVMRQSTNAPNTWSQLQKWLQADSRMGVKLTQLAF